MYVRYVCICRSSHRHTSEQACLSCDACAIFTVIYVHMSNVCMYACITQWPMCIHACMCVYMYIYVCIYVHIYTPNWKHMYAYSDRAIDTPRNRPASAVINAPFSWLFFMYMYICQTYLRMYVCTCVHMFINRPASAVTHAPFTR